jgi:caffeoyl-CoA O-methyltransferase
MRDTQPHPRIEYIRKLFTKNDEFLQMSLDAMKSLDMQINIGPEDGKLLQILIKSIGAKKAVEIGTLTGYSAIWIARALGDEGLLYSLEKNERNAEIARRIILAASLENVVQIIQGDAEKTLTTLQGPFDFIFVDANKPSYLYYLEWAKANIRFGGIIVADNTYLSESVYLEEIPDHVRLTTWNQMKEFNVIAANSEGFESVMLPSAEGMTILLKTNADSD